MGGHASACGGVGMHMFTAGEAARRSRLRLMCGARFRARRRRFPLGGRVTCDKRLGGGGAVCACGTVLASGGGIMYGSRRSVFDAGVRASRRRVWRCRGGWSRRARAAGLGAAVGWHISIYYLILGSYAPICLITLYDYSGISIFIAVLTLSIIGTLKKLFLTGKYEFISLLLYLAMGWLIIFDINSLFSLIDFNAKLLLILGGVSYTFGIIFYAFDKIKYFHSIWHLFVLTGSVLHYFMVLLYII